MCNSSDKGRRTHELNPNINSWIESTAVILHRLQLVESWNEINDALVNIMTKGRKYKLIRRNKRTINSRGHLLGEGDSRVL